MKLFLISLLLLTSPSLIFAQNIIPIPVKYEQTQEKFIFDNNVDFIIPNGNSTIKTYVENFITFLGANGSASKILNKKANKKAINILLVKNAEIGEEGYILEVKSSEITLSATTHKGVFNGLQTLRQLLPSDWESKSNPSSKGEIIGCKIVDYPRYKWRGLMLDVSRHFFTVDEVKQYIDRMSTYKFNVFHWHLSDDEGWRVEIKSLPKLTELGAWRVERNGRFGEGRPYPKEGEKNTYGGFYTQEQIKDVVKYAAERNITIVPEIDMPGHSMAILTAYPELSTKKEPKFVNPGSKFAEWFGPHEFKMLIENTLNPADEKVYEFVDKVMTELAQLFPGEYIHMGGDEAYHGFWEEDKNVQAFMKKNNLKDTKELQGYFVKRVNTIINSKGKKMIGWDEILDGGGLPKSTSVMSWRGMDGGIKAAKDGHQVVMAPTTFAYIDYTQGDKSVENPIYSDLSLAKSYSFEPTPEGVDPKYILGGQANLWTEVIPTIQFAFYMTYPRAMAIAEKVWSPKGASDFTNFLNRLEGEFKRFDNAEVNISKAIYEPEVKVIKRDNKFILELSTAIPNAEVFYSLDNTYPAKYAKKYNAPVEIPEGDLKLRTQTYRNGHELGRELIIPREDLIKRAK
jgi:hexosaminidase